MSSGKKWGNQSSFIQSWQIFLMWMVVYSMAGSDLRCFLVYEQEKLLSRLDCGPRTIKEFPMPWNRLDVNESALGQPQDVFCGHPFKPSHLQTGIPSSKSLMSGKVCQHLWAPHTLRQPILLWTTLMAEKAFFKIELKSSSLQLLTILLLILPLEVQHYKSPSSTWQSSHPSKIALPRKSSLGGWKSNSLSQFPCGTGVQFGNT